MKSTNSLSNNDLVIAIAQSQIGYKEGANNKTMYGEWFGLDNQPWCAMFVSWVFNQAGESKNVCASTRKGFASCDAGLKWFTRRNKLVPVGQAKAGDIVFFQFDNDAEPDHVGIVLKNNGKNSLVCIEGNTSPNNKGSQSNGGGVYRKKRSYATVMAVARP